MSFRQKYLFRLYGNRQHMECEPMSDDSSLEPWSDSSLEPWSDSSLEPWSDSSDSGQETEELLGIPPPNDITPQRNHEYQQQRSREDNYYDQYLYRIKAKRRVNDDAGEMFFTRQNPSGSARTEKFPSRKKYDMFSWLSSKHRKFPTLSQSAEETLSSIDGDLTLPLATRYRNLKKAANLHLGVYRSKIHGRGLFSLVDIAAGAMVIEFVGEVIRSRVSVEREKYYKEKGIDCYMFRIDDEFIIDGTMKGNIARFINHSCEPNCSAEVLEIHGKQRLIIVAQSSIDAKNEITCGYMFQSEKGSISCLCESKTCRKFLN